MENQTAHAHPVDATRCCSSSHEPPDTAYRRFELGANGRCTFCDHEEKCHPGPGATCEIGSGERGRQPDERATVEAIRKLLEALPDEAARAEVLEAVLVNRCRKCLDYDPQGSFWCCYDSRGG